LNQLYNTRINDIDVETLARHIVGIDIDPLLAQGSHVAVDRITICPPLRRYLSFASKFCSWHNPTAYTIYDGNARACLWAYQKQDKFGTFLEQDLWVYADFCAAVISFSSHYGLDSFNLKQLDKFLYRAGGSLRGERFIDSQPVSGRLSINPSTLNIRFQSPVWAPANSPRPQGCSLLRRTWNRPSCLPSRWTRARAPHVSRWPMSI